MARPAPSDPAPTPPSSSQECFSELPDPTPPPPPPTSLSPAPAPADVRAAPLVACFDSPVAPPSALHAHSFAVWRFKKTNKQKKRRASAWRGNTPSRKSGKQRCERACHDDPSWWFRVASPWLWKCPRRAEEPNKKSLQKRRYQVVHMAT